MVATIGEKIVQTSLFGEQNNPHPSPSKKLSVPSRRMQAKEELHLTVEITQFDNLLAWHMVETTALAYNKSTTENPKRL